MAVARAIYRPLYIKIKGTTSWACGMAVNFLISPLTQSIFPEMWPSRFVLPEAEPFT